LFNEIICPTSFHNSITIQLDSYLSFQFSLYHQQNLCGLQRAPETLEILTAVKIGSPGALELSGISTLAPEMLPNVPACTGFAEDYG